MAGRISAWISIASLIDRFYRATFYMAGLTPKTANLKDGTVIHSWVPRNPQPHKPNLVLVHGFGSSAMLQWGGLVGKFTASFNVYVPDLLFFGDSYTTCANRTMEFQAKCVMDALRSLGLSTMSVIGMSYGGFVAYSMAAQFPEEVERVVLVGADVCWTEKDIDGGSFIVKGGMDEVARFLMPQTADEARDLINVMFYRPPRNMPSFYLDDYIAVKGSQYPTERKEIVEIMFKGWKPSDLHKIHQPIQLIWGEHDLVFPLETAHRLMRFLDEKPQLVIIKNVGHAVVAEQPTEAFEHMKAFLAY